MDDTNIDLLDINILDTLETSSQIYKIITLFDQLITKIYLHGVKQCVVGATPSCLGAKNPLLDLLSWPV